MKNIVFIILTIFFDAYVVPVQIPGVMTETLLPAQPDVVAASAVFLLGIAAVVVCFASGKRE